MLSLYRSKYHVVELDPVQRIVWVRRTSEHADHLAADMDLATQSLARHDRTVLGLLIDLRQAPLNNDPEFEREMQPAVTRIYASFAITAVLVATSVGRMQIRRQSREIKRSPGVFIDEQEAVAYIREHLKASKDAAPKSRGSR